MCHLKTLSYDVYFASKHRFYIGYDIVPVLKLFIVPSHVKTSFSSVSPSKTQAIYFSSFRRVFI